ncbi:MAG TPA: DEAD/DEAH box helicase family protein [Candidatus Pacearchaeota archaeon]|nr:DEAD/DEAH box helicase family protein [Candidatus Pacearchaeota archaeon]HPC31281.1 DEAD/DEAH box helicase family protein [Candidatus Paceibacterota bacterium]HPL72919.1 DEAD/DEAH box helicase family protein [Candidatus Pacearchaeota archaeon]
MDPKIILQKLIEKERLNLEIPSEWRYRDIKKFGIDWELFPYQQEAIENITDLLYLLFNDWQNQGLDKGKKDIMRLYKKYGLDQELENSLSITKDNGNYNFLINYFPVGPRIPFEAFINRAAFWMATASGKTLVMIKLLAVLSDLISKKLIPQKDILILAPKDDILNQIKEHIDKFNKGAEITINLKNLKEYERVKNQQSIFNKSEITVFYYRADNIAGKDMIAKKKDGQRLNYESFFNDGNWYLILDEAHKGEKETSLRQQYFMALTKSGFLFNFSATFTDQLDIITTIYDYKLDTFLKDGYGKKLYVSDANFQSFSRRDNTDFTDNDKKNIIVQSLLVLALAKSHFYKLRSINRNLYHAPLLVTLANSVNTEEADLKIFFKLLSKIATGDFDFEKAKNNLVNKLEESKKYLFGLGEIDLHLIAELREFKEKDFREAVFNSRNKGNIEVVKFRENQGELAFKLVNGDKYFMLIRASNVIEWENNTLSGYEIGRVIEESFFDDINKKNDINILLGSRVFTEGWDSNRPNIINYINIGVSDEAKKYVLQSIGRGIRIEPIPHKRKRFESLENDIFSDSERENIVKSNKILESLFIFATNKEVIKNILEGLEKQSSPEWINLSGINKNESIKEKDLPIFIPAFEGSVLNEKPFWIGANEFTEVSELVKKAGPKVLLLKNNIRLRTYKKVCDQNNFIVGTRRRKRTPENILFVADSYFNEPIKKLSGIKILEGEISHYQEIMTNLCQEEAEKLERDILKIVKPRMTEEQIDRLFEEKKITLKEYKEKIKELATKDSFEALNNYLEFKILEEHYYSPILFKKDSEHFQHIIKEQSEIDFLEALKNYLTDKHSNLKSCEWWYFSKIDQAIDKIGIPYFDSELGEYRTFFPDFIFWLKKNNKYYLKFIDPHGVQFIGNSADKIDGFNQFKSDLANLKNKNIHNAEMYFYNEQGVPHGVDSAYSQYWTSNFEDIFNT